MDLTKVTSESFDDFKKNTGILLPITKFILSNTLLLGLLIAVPFNIIFWVYQIGYLSTFGINYELILRGSFEAQGLWGEMFSTFASELLHYPVYLLISLCGILFIKGVFKRASRFLKHCKIVRKQQSLNKNGLYVHPTFKIKKARPSNFWRVMAILIPNTKGKTGLFVRLAYASYSSSILFLIVVLTVLLLTSNVYEKAKDQSNMRITAFLKHNTCNDGWGQTGCYSVIKGKERFEGYLVAMNDLHIYFMTTKELMIIPRDKDVLVKRKLTIPKDT